MRISFRCSGCQQLMEVGDLSREEVACPACRRATRLQITEPMRRDNTVAHCALCDCPKVYVQKDFNRTLGIAIFIAGAIVSLVLYGFNLVWQAMAVLLGCAVVDAVLYKVLPEVTICYKCQSQYRQVSSNPAVQPFELGLAEKFDPLDKRREAENPAADWHGR